MENIFLIYGQRPIRISDVAGRYAERGPIILREKVNADTTTEVTEVKSDVYEELECYPNPMDDKVSLSLANGSLVHCVVFDISGNCVINTSLHNTNATLNTASLKAGVYFLKASTQQKTYTIKLIKQ
jgi:hypothetical protein